MAEESDADDTGPSLTSVVSSLVIAATLILGFGLLAAGQWWFWVVFVVGFAGVLPVVPVLVGWYENRSSSGTRSPLDTLRDRYARGEIDEAEFERRLDALLETETERDAAQFPRESGPNATDAPVGPNATDASVGPDATDATVRPDATDTSVAVDVETDAERDHTERERDLAQE